MKKLNKTNPILRTDSYKYSHFLQYPPGTCEVSSYIEARAGARFKNVTFFGLQMFLKELSARPVTYEDVDEATKFVAAHGLPFNRDGWLQIVRDLGGDLPLEIQAIPEGMTVPIGTPLVQVRNTDGRFQWMTTFIETALLRAVWYPSTVATVSRAAKNIIHAGLVKTGDDPDGSIGFKLHDFGARGCTSSEQAGIGGAAHLINFMGSDTVEGVVYARNYYGAEMAAYSIPAAEHSTITSWGRDGEAAAYRNMLSQFAAPGKIVAVVSDSYDIEYAVGSLWGIDLRKEVLASGGTVVIRPDSGDPVETPIRVIEMLARTFGTTKNKKGYWVLNNAVRVIQGDGMSLEKISAVVRTLIQFGYSIDNIAFGVGGGLLQQVDRDTMRFAMKTNEVVINGDRIDVSKAPVGDSTKASKAGRLAVIAKRGIVNVFREMNYKLAADEKNLLEPVWRDGKLLRDMTFENVRDNACSLAAEWRSPA